jgi:hypothetical protein
MREAQQTAMPGFLFSSYIHPRIRKLSFYTVVFLLLYLLAYSHTGLVRSVREGLRLNSEFLLNIVFSLTISQYRFRLKIIN